MNTSNLIRPIQTYGYKGVSKAGIIKSQHAIMFTTDKPPAPLPEEEPQEGEAGMLEAIKVKPEKKGDPMDQLSRVNFGRIYTVEHNVKVYDFGQVHRKYQHILEAQFNQVWYASRKTQTINEEEEDEDEDEEGEEEAEAEEE
jgi:hypothetical protein